MIKHSGPISGICAYGTDYVATAGYDNQVILWDARTQQALARGCHDHLANQCVFHPDGHILASSSSDHSARIWSVPGMRLLAVLKDHDDDVEGLAFHPSRSILATASRDGRVRLFDFDGGLLCELAGHRADVLSVSWNPAGQLVSSSDDGTVRCWDIEARREVAQLDFSGVETDTIAIASDGTIFAGNDLGEIAVVVDGASTTVQAHKAGIKKLCYSDRSGILVSLSYDRTAVFWRTDGARLTRLSQASLPPIVWPRSCDFLGDDKVAFVTFGGTYAVYDLGLGAWDVEDVEPTHGINAVCVHEGRVFTVGDAGVVREQGRAICDVGSLCNFLVSFEDLMLAGGQMGQLFDALTGEVYYQHRSPFNCAAVIHGGERPMVAIGSYTGEMLLFARSASGLQFARAVTMHENAIKGLATNGEAVFSVCATSAVGLVGVGDWDNVEEITDAHGKIANGCVSLPDARFASVSRDLKLRVWRGGRAETFDTPHRNSIKCCAANARGGLLATGDYTGHVGIFSLREERFVDFSRLTASGISSLIAAPEGEGFLASSYDGSIYSVSVTEKALA